MTATPAAVIVLSAGDGTRMKSRRNKALHAIGGRTLVGHAVSAAVGTGAQYVAVVVRAQKEPVAAAAREICEEIVVAEQDDVYGTGRAPSAVCSRCRTTWPARSWSPPATLPC